MQLGVVEIPVKPLVLALALAYAGLPAMAQDAVKSLSEVTVLGTAEDAWKQALGVSTISAQDIEKRPPANDLSEIIRTMPGVNLTGNSTSGQRGNNRQIDLRGMGPENTLILIDGKPASSRNSVRYGWRGERDSRGDSNWVAPELVEGIEVLRGPAAARYGNGAAGGVVNIITKKGAKETHGQVSLYANAPEHSDEGATQRLNFSLSGPLSEDFSYRLTGNSNETGADGQYINAGKQAPGYASVLPAGREGVRNKDLSAQLSWRLLPGQTLDLDLSYGRQGNIYTGDTQNVGSIPANAAIVAGNRGAETNIMTKRTLVLTHKGKFDFGNTMSYLQWGDTENARLQEGLVGGTEGAFSSNTFLTSLLQDVSAHSEVNIPLRGTWNQMLTAGVEWTGQKLQDPSSNSQANTFGNIPGLSNTGRSPDSSASIASVFVEDNIELAANTLLTPGLRFDQHTQSGVNWSPSLNLTQLLGSKVTLKAGVASAYKAPNLFQSNPNYLLYSNNNGCQVVTNGTTGCFLLGNPDLKPETSINKELGLEYKDEGFSASVTWFHNDYRNKIQAGTTPIGISATNNHSIFQWTNIGESVVQGLEGSVRLPVSKSLDWINNFTYMIESKNKSTGDYLSVIPEYTLNSTLDWRVSGKLGMLFTATFYGEQKPMKYDYKGGGVTGTSANTVSPYAVVSVGSNYEINKGWKMSAGINNLFDKRQFRQGNAVSVTSTPVYGTTGGAGAATYNESGRTVYVSLTSSF